MTDINAEESYTLTAKEAKDMSQKLEQDEIEYRLQANFKMIRDCIDNGEREKTRCLSECAGGDENLVLLQENIRCPRFKRGDTHIVNLTTEEKIDKYFGNNKLRAAIFKELLKKGFAIDLMYRWEAKTHFEACFIMKW